MKTHARDLAILGGPPAFPDGLHVGRPNIGDRSRFLSRVNDVLDRRWLSNDGPLVREFEARVAEAANVSHCVAVCNGMMGLELAARAMNLRGEVIVPSFTFVATAHVLQWLDITPVFCDIGPDGYTIDPRRAEELITPQTTAILGVHLWGRPCDTAALTRIAEAHRLRLLFDAAHAFGCSSGGRAIGGFGDAEVFSFHATKFVNSGEGGAVVTNDALLADRLRLLRNFGFAGYDRVISLGTNGKMSELSAAMGLTSLDSMQTFIEVNRRNYHLYRQELSHLPGLSLVRYDEGERNNFQHVVVKVDERRCGTTRDRLIEILHAENVFARRYFYPGCHRMEPYVRLQPDASLRLPKTEEATAAVMSLPTGTSIGADEIRTIGSILRFAQDAAVSSNLSSSSRTT